MKRVNHYLKTCWTICFQLGISSQLCRWYGSLNLAYLICSSIVTTTPNWVIPFNQRLMLCVIASRCANPQAITVFNMVLVIYLLVVMRLGITAINGLKYYRLMPTHDLKKKAFLIVKPAKTFCEP